MSRLPLALAGAVTASPLVFLAWKRNEAFAAMNDLLRMVHEEHAVRPSLMELANGFAEVDGPAVQGALLLSAGLALASAILLAVTRKGIGGPALGALLAAGGLFLAHRGTQELSSLHAQLAADPDFAAEVIAGPAERTEAEAFEVLAAAQERLDSAFDPETPAHSVTQLEVVSESMAEAVGSPALLRTLGLVLAALGAGLAMLSSRRSS